MAIMLDASSNKSHQEFFEVEGVIRLEKIMEYGEQEDIALPNLLSGFFLELIFEQFQKVNWNNKLLLRNHYNLGLYCYKEQVQNKLEYILISDKEEIDLDGKIEEIFKNLQDEQYSFDYQVKPEGCYTVKIQASWERYQVPINVMILKMNHLEINPVKETYNLNFFLNKTFNYLEYPVEVQLAENIIYILDKLELINEMKVYDYTYIILSGNTIQGRKTFRLFSNYFANRSIDSLEIKWSYILGYRDYQYMIKKWKSYHKKVQKEMVSWEEIINVMDAFFTPIIAAINNDEVFFGDWMPHLKRYLD